MPRKSTLPPAARSGSASSGLVVGGRGGPEDELLQSGQEEVFSRTEVERGRIEHQADAGGGAVDKARRKTRGGRTTVRR